jgi:putative redox protein
MKKTVKVTANYVGGMRIDAKAGDHLAIIDQPEAGGGKNEGPSPLDYFFFALGGCLGTIAAVVARQERIELRGFSVAIEADIDTAFLMGKTTEGRAGFTEVRVNVDIDADMTAEEKEAFFEKVDFRCPISDNMVNDTKIVFDVK